MIILWPAYHRCIREAVGLQAPLPHLVEEADGPIYIYIYICVCV